MKILPFYLVGLALLFVGVFYDDILPIANWWDSAMSTTGLFDFSKPTIGLFMLAAMLFSIFVGFPISFTLIFLAFTFGAWGTNSALTFFLLTLQTNSVMLSDQLVAVPLFILMGIMMEQAGLMERLFNAVQLMMSRTRGALYIAVLLILLPRFNCSILASIVVPGVLSKIEIVLRQLANLWFACTAF